MKMDKFVIIDLETTGNSPDKGDRIIEIGIVVWSRGRIVDQFSRLINPNVPISRFISRLTGISSEDVRSEPLFEDVAQEVRALFDESYFVAHNVPFDLGFLNSEFERVGLEPLTQPIIDTVELSRMLLPTAPGFKLGQLAEWLCIDHHNPHRALSDAYVTTQLLSHLLNKLLDLPLIVLEKLKQIEPYIKSSLALILTDRINQTYHNDKLEQEFELIEGLALRVDPLEEIQPQPVSISFGEFLDDLYKENGKLTALNNYEIRQGQREMSEMIYDAYQSKRHGVIEAGTGTGKSLAYLISAIYQAVYANERIVISTYLTQLQNQLMEKEIPLLKKILPFNFHVTVLKGKQHYLSLDKFSQSLKDNSNDNYDHTLTKAILLIWLTETRTGDIDEINLPPSGYRFFRKVSCENEGNKHQSFYQWARDRAKNAHLVITNHAMLCTHLTHEQTILPKFDKLIVDEAHHLTTSTAKHFGLQLSYVSIQRLLNSVEQLFINATDSPFVREVKQILQNTKEEADTLFRFLFHFVKGKNTHKSTVNDVGRFQYTLTEQQSSDWIICLDMVSRVCFSLRDLVIVLQHDQHLSAYDQNIIGVNKAAINQLVDTLNDFFYKGLENGRVNWIEIEAYGAQNAVYLYQEPVEVSAFLKQLLFEEKESIILTSASLTIKDSFDHFKTSVGLDSSNIIEQKINSPYSYHDQVKLLIPNDFPVAHYKSMDAFIEATCEAIFSLAEITNGRMLVLFTSYELLKKAYHLLKEVLSEDYVIIAQGISSGSRSRLKKSFQMFEHSILLGTNAFWEGVDIPGSKLSSVVIVRLPFESPNHPVFQAKAEQLKREGKNSFIHLSLPNAVIKFKQGFGRLIRSSTDKGIVVVCDDRLMTAKYGKYFIKSIPKVPIYHQKTSELLEIASEWL